jgi:aryl-alcohol dehydrogenase-like predicted oxidoreductase
MLTRRLGRTGLEVTAIGYGAMQLRGPASMDGPEISEDRAGEVLNAVLDAGISLIDTARSYGLSEERIGRHLAHRRGEFVLATKSHCGGDWSADNVRRDIETSLQLLRTDRVDILQLHNPGLEDVRRGRLDEELESIRSEGLAGHVGISTFLPEALDFIAMGCFEVFQFPYSCVQQRHREAMERAAVAGAGVIARGALNWGGPRAPGARGFVRRMWEAAGVDEALGGTPPVEMMVRFALAHPDCHTNIFGSTDPDHVRQNAAAAELGPLDPARAEDIAARFAAARDSVQD